MKIFEKVLVGSGLCPECWDYEGSKWTSGHFNPLRFWKNQQITKNNSLTRWAALLQLSQPRPRLEPLSSGYITSWPASDETVPQIWAQTRPFPPTQPYKPQKPQVQVLGKVIKFFCLLKVKHEEPQFLHKDSVYSEVWEETPFFRWVPFSGLDRR